jgi:hypothetical protein
MITALEIENFKAIRDRMRIELKPITLLFGPNSGGKSTILHALHYAREILERHNLDVNQTVVGGKFIDLGGFRNLVHGHNLARSVVLRFDLDVAENDLPPYWETLDRIGEHFALVVENLYTRVNSASVTVELAHSELLQHVYVHRYTVELDGTLFAEITHLPDRRSTALTKLDTKHPALLCPRDMATVDPSPDELESLRDVHGDINRSVLDSCLEAVQGLLPFTGDGSLPLLGQDDALPVLDRWLQLATETPEPVAPGTVSLLTRELLLEELMIGLTQMIVGPGRLLREALQTTRYLGPLRETPPRNFAPVGYPEPSRWANGFAAWDRLYSEPTLAKRVNAWLSGPDSLEVGYTIKVKTYKEFPTESPLFVLLRSGRAFEDLEDAKGMLDELPTRTTVTLVPDNTNIEVMPHDVGVGISQLIPVTVLAVDAEGRLDTIEQPELHVHPAVQARLGDLFIQQVAADPTRRFLLETHSEHLLLRLLRRIRETTEGDLPPGHPGLTPDQVAVIYVELGDHEVGREQAGPPGMSLQVHPLRIDETGEFLDRWPHGFFEERAKELF